MNERIRELAEQANAFARENVEYSRTEGFEMFTEKLYEVSREKFAELIVRETLDQVAEISRLTKAYQVQGIDPEIDVAKEVLKNFGVEE